MELQNLVKGILRHRPSKYVSDELQYGGVLPPHNSESCRTETAQLTELHSVDCFIQLQATVSFLMPSP